ncbi:MAG: cytidylyltransferase domain-containing protein [Actinomycetota bacterium]
MTRTIAVIQARLGSQRFPEKMLAELGGHSLLEWVVRRVQRSELLDRVVVATTQEPLDDRLVAKCKQLGVEVRRGSTNDVLGRFVSAIEGDTVDAVVRVCADNPFIDPGCIDQVVREFHGAGVEYAFNHRPYGDCNYADGFGAEVISAELLRRLATMNLTPQQREHVTLAIVDESVQVKSLACTAPPQLAYPHLRFDVDTSQDLMSLQRLVSEHEVTFNSSAETVITARSRTMRVTGLQSE